MAWYVFLKSMNLIIHQSISIQSVPSKVWKALTDVELIRKYLSEIFPPQLTEHQEGKILHIIPEKLLHKIYPTGDGLDRKVISYYHIIYKLEAEDEITTVRIAHENIENQNRAKVINDSWRSFLLAIKNKLDREGSDNL